MLSRLVDRLGRRALPSCDQSRLGSAEDFAVAATAADEALEVGQRLTLQYSSIAVMELAARFEVVTCAAARCSGRDRSLPAPFGRRAIGILGALEAVHAGPLPLVLAVAVSALGRALRPRRLRVIMGSATLGTRQHHGIPSTNYQ